MQTARRSYRTGQSSEDCQTLPPTAEGECHGPAPTGAGPSMRRKRAGAIGGGSRMFGVAVSKATLVCTLIDRRTRAVARELTVPNTPAGVALALAQAPADCPWVLEPTGRYSGPVAAQAQAAGRTVLLAGPRRAQAFLRATQPRAKTDRVDSRGLALYGLATTLRPSPRKSATVERVKHLLAARTSLSETIARLRQQRADLPHAAEPLDAALQALAAQRAELDRRLASETAQTDELPGVARLATIPGVGPVTAAAVAACLQATALASAEAFVASIGLAGRARASGQFQGRRKLSKRGDAELRRLFYLGACANLTSKGPDNPFKQQYTRERAKGLSSPAALNAVARQLAKVCWSIVRHDGTYDPVRVAQQPTPRTQPSDRALDNQP